MAVGEVILGAFLTLLLERLASSELMNFLRPAGIDVQLKKWRRKLSVIEALLDDAENMQASSWAVKEWLIELEDLVYDLDDLVDQMNTEAMQHKLIKPDQRTSKVQQLFSTFTTTFSIHDFISERKIKAELEEIDDRLEDLYKEVDMISEVMKVKGKGRRTIERSQPTSVVQESAICGRKNQKEDIIKLLLGVKSTDSPILSVIPIVGMGGVGKTTLAQVVYNDCRIKDAFELRAWACISDVFNATRVTKIILDAVSRRSCGYDDLNVLQVTLKEALSNKKFLVVLDDIWNENYNDWDILRQPFLFGKPGSKIIITTRNEMVAKITSQLRAYPLSGLSDEDALSLLALHSLGAKTFSEHQDLIEIGMSIVRRCGNLPLAVKTIGGLLHSTANSPKDWNDMLNSEFWIAEQSSGILPALKLSYRYLPPHLKRCFAYCAIFPKDYEFDKSKLVYLWLAEGYLHESEKLGHQYFDQLLARSFFQKSSANTSCFVMHDLIHDLAMFVAGDKCFRMVEEDSAHKIPEKVRHFSISRLDFEYACRKYITNKVQGLRTFMSLPILRSGYPELPAEGMLTDLWPHLNRLRVLSLSGYYIFELPDSVGNLKHLRYLDLASTCLKLLPESVSTLINLKVLILRNCRRLTKLPAHMENLVNLCHLDIAETLELHDMPLGLDKLTSLQTLSKMVASKSNGMRLESLGNLSLLQYEISIEELQNVVTVQEAIDARLMNKPKLHRIKLKWTNEFDGSRNKIQEMEVLSALKPHENLSSLKIVFYGGAKFSDWIGDPIFSKLAKISFDSCRNCTSLPSLGRLPFLRELSISHMDKVKVIGAEFFGDIGQGGLPFPSLESLDFSYMRNWKEWHGLANEADSVCATKLDQLRKLQLYKCPVLVKFPILSLPSLDELKVADCGGAQSDESSDSSNEIQKMESMLSLPSLDELKVTDCGGAQSDESSDFEIQKMELLSALIPREYLSMFSLLSFDKLKVTDCGGAQSDESNDSSNEIQKMELLSALRPHEYSSILEISFSCCRDCTSLPPLGQLHFLKKLTIQNMDKLTVIGVEFWESRSQEEFPFPSLECLIIEDLPNWVEWHGFGNEADCVIKLARLHELRLKRCPKLVALPILSLPSLSILSVKECGVEVLNHMHNFRCLKGLQLQDIFGLTCLPKTFVPFS